MGTCKHTAIQRACGRLVIMSNFLYYSTGEHFMKYECLIILLCHCAESTFLSTSLTMFHKLSCIC